MEGVELSMYFYIEYNRWHHGVPDYLLGCGLGNVAAQLFSLGGSFNLCLKYILYKGLIPILKQFWPPFHDL